MLNDMQCHSQIVCGKNLPHTNKIRKPCTSASRLSVFLLLTRKRQPRCRWRFREGDSKTLSRGFAELRGFAEPFNVSKANQKNYGFFDRFSQAVTAWLDKSFFVSDVREDFAKGRPSAKDRKMTYRSIILGVRPRGPVPFMFIGPLGEKNHKLKILYYD